MLVLARNKNEAIVIGEEITITVLDIRPNKVRIGISAPQGIAVHRKEIYLAIQRDRAIERNKEAGRQGPMALGHAAPATDGDSSHGVMDEATNATTCDRNAGTDAATEGGQ